MDDVTKGGLFDAAAGPIGGRRIAFPLLMTILIMAELVCSLESNMIYVTLSEVYRTTGDPVHAGWLVTAFTLTAAGAAAVCSRLGDIFGRQRLLAIMLGIAMLGSTISALAPSLDLIIVGRAFQGASMAVLPLCYGILRQNAPPERIPFGVGVLGGLYAYGTGLGAMLGGFIMKHFHWQGIFVASALLAAVAFLAVAFILPPSRRYPVKGRLDILGGLLFVPTVAMILLSLTFLKDHPFGSWHVAGLLGAGVVLLALWCLYELRHPEPLIDVRLLGNRSIAMADLGMVAIAAAPMLSIMIITPLLQQPAWSGAGFALSSSLTGTIFFLLGLWNGTAVIFAGHLAGRFGTRAVILTAAIGLTIGSIIMMPSLWSLAGVLLIMGLLHMPGVSLTFAMIPSVVIHAAPEERTSEATGLTQVIRSIGMAGGSLLLPYLLSTDMRTDPSGSGQHLPGPHGYILAFGAMTLLSAISVAAIMAIPKREFVRR